MWKRFNQNKNYYATRIATRIKKIMKQKNITQTLMANELDIPKHTVDRVVNGLEMPNAMDFILILEYLDLSLEDLMKVEL